MAKLQQSLSLAPEIWAQIDDLVPYFGESRGEVITYALNIWFGTQEQQIQDRKARIDALRPQIDKLVQQARQKTKTNASG